MSVSVEQHTLKNCIRATGVGLHTGEQINLLLRPGAANSGIVLNVAILTINLRSKPMP